MRMFLGILAAVALLAAPVFAQHGKGHGPHGHGHEEMIGRMMSHLDLTPVQKDEVHEILTRQRTARDAKRAAVKSAHDAFAALIMADDFDEPAIRDAADAVAAAQSELMLEHAWLSRDLRRVLTPEQMDQVREMHEHHATMRGERGRHRGGFMGWLHGLHGGDSDE